MASVKLNIPAEVTSVEQIHAIAKELDRAKAELLKPKVPTVDFSPGKLVHIQATGSVYLMTHQMHHDLNYRAGVKLFHGAKSSHHPEQIGRIFYFHINGGDIFCDKNLPVCCIVTKRQ